jgi:hypothetical protein
MCEKLNPLSLKPAERAYFYDHVLLGWETSKTTQNHDIFNTKKVLEACGAHVVAISALKDLATKEATDLPAEYVDEGYLYFFNAQGKDYSSGYSCLMKRLRDTVAHGHYTSDTKNWIKIRHVFNEKTRIFGHIEMKKLKALVKFMDVRYEKPFAE